LNTSPDKEKDKKMFNFQQPAFLIHWHLLQSPPFPKAMKSFKQASSILPL
jgi:hypothetical protein